MKKEEKSPTFSCLNVLAGSLTRGGMRRAENCSCFSGKLRKRGQGWGFDLMIAMVIFLGGIIFFYFFLVNDSGGESGRYGVLEGEGKVISDNLFSSGFPENWDSSSVVRIGIVDGERINQTKLEMFYLLDYEQTKVLFNIKNDYYITFSGNVSVQGSEVGAIGLEPTDVNNLARTTRLVIYNNSVRTMEVFVWD